MSSIQAPIIDTPFDAASTADEVAAEIDLTGKTAIVTGGHSGIGRETTRVLAERGAHVVVPVRNPDKAATMLDGVPGVDIRRLDLLDPASVDAFAEGFLDQSRPLHILVNSAAVMAVPLSYDPRGYETHFATNHLGHFQLTSRLWPALAAAGKARVVAVSAAAHRFSAVNVEDPFFEHREYRPILGYAQSKTANILFAKELDRRAQAHDVRAFSVHPGAILKTNLSSYATPEMLRAMKLTDGDGEPIIDPYAGKKTIAQGASTMMWCAVSPQLDDMGGVYCEDTNVAALATEDDHDPSRHGHEEAIHVGVSPHAVDPEAAERVWELSETLTGVGNDH